MPDSEIAGWRCAYPAYKTATIRQKEARKPVGRIRHLCRDPAKRRPQTRRPDKAFTPPSGD
ncbi:Hypothetical protein ABZS17H1_03008 [Kosakonia cowanii]